MTKHLERGEHPGLQKFRTIKRVAETAVDTAFVENPHATEEQKRQLAGDLNWALLRLRFSVGGDPITIWKEFETNVRNFPNNSTS